MGFLGCNGNRRTFLKTTAAAVLGQQVTLAQKRPANIILIYADDLGYGDLGCYGSSIATPVLDQMAQEGARFTQFLSSSSVCSPARAALLTGRYGARVGVMGVLDPDEKGGLSLNEMTMAQMLKQSGYATACVGKWHLGAQTEYLPTNRGFDEYFGIPYSNDMWPRPLMLGTEVIERPAKLSTLTQRYTAYAVDFITRSKDKPFFLYLPHTFPHIPLAASPEFAGRSGQGLYGDAVQEIDWSTGVILQTLQSLGLDDNTLVIFTSDNGPWYQGSRGRLRGRKGESYEGGFRVPFIARFPGRIPPGQVNQAFAHSMDLMPTVARLTGAAPPAGPLDGVDIWPLLTGEQRSVDHEVFIYFNGPFVQAARLNDWKVHVARFNVPLYTPTPAEGRLNLPLPRPELYNVMRDPEESYDRSERNADVLAAIQLRLDNVIRTFPSYVASTYYDTFRLQVEDTPADALPIRRVP